MTLREFFALRAFSNAHTFPPSAQVRGIRREVWYFSTSFRTFSCFDFNLVSAIFMGPRSVGSIIVYCLIAAAAIWLIISPIITNGMLKLRGDRVAREVKQS